MKRTKQMQMQASRLDRSNVPVIVMTTAALGAPSTVAVCACMTVLLIGATGDGGGGEAVGMGDVGGGERGGGGGGGGGGAMTSGTIA